MKKDCHHTYADQHEAHYDYCSACAKELVLALSDYVVLNALEHDDPDCPQDDTCDCAVTRRLSNALDAAIAAIAGTLDKSDDCRMNGGAADKEKPYDR